MRISLINLMIFSKKKSLLFNSLTTRLSEVLMNLLIEFLIVNDVFLIKIRLTHTLNLPLIFFYKIVFINIIYVSIIWKTTMLILINWAVKISVDTLIFILIKIFFFYVLHIFLLIIVVLCTYYLLLFWFVIKCWIFW